MHRRCEDTEPIQERKLNKKNISSGVWTYLATQSLRHSESEQDSYSLGQAFNL